MDDITALTKLTASGLDDVTAGIAEVGSEAITIAVDDTAVTPQYVEGIDPRRRISTIGGVAKGLLINKGTISVKILLSSAFVPWVLIPLLMAGGSYPYPEGAHKIWDKLTGYGRAQAAITESSQAEDVIVKNTVRIDFTLSTEIVVVALTEVTEQNIAHRAAILAVTAVLVTTLVYGIVACPAEIDNLGLHMASEESSATRKMRWNLVKAIPKALSAITVIGVAAMLWVGGYLLVSGSDRLG